jgi:hypothetical protein
MWHAQVGDAPPRKGPYSNQTLRKELFRGLGKDKFNLPVFILATYGIFFPNGFFDGNAKEMPSVLRVRLLSTAVPAVFNKEAVLPVQ